MSLVLATSSDENLSQPSDAELKAGPPILKAPKTLIAKGTVDIVTPQVAAALGKTNISDRKAAHIITMIASAELLKQHVKGVIISASGIRQAHMKHHKLFSLEVKEIFDPAVPLILHWDGKIMDDLTGSE